jgi:hypothetical protein
MPDAQQGKSGESKNGHGTRARGRDKCSLGCVMQDFHITASRIRFHSPAGASLSGNSRTKIILHELHFAPCLSGFSVCLAFLSGSDKRANFSTVVLLDSRWPHTAQGVNTRIPEYHRFVHLSSSKIVYLCISHRRNQV